MTERRAAAFALLLRAVFSSTRADVHLPAGAPGNDGNTQQQCPSPYYALSLFSLVAGTRWLGEESILLPLVSPLSGGRFVRVRTLPGLCARSPRVADVIASPCGP